MNDCWLSGNSFFSSWDGLAFLDVWSVCSVFLCLTCAHLLCHVPRTDRKTMQQWSVFSLARCKYSLWFAMCVISISRVRKEILGTPKKCNTVCTEKSVSQSCSVGACVSLTPQQRHTESVELTTGQPADRTLCRHWHTSILWLLFTVPLICIYW